MNLIQQSKYSDMSGNSEGRGSRGEVVPEWLALLERMIFEHFSDAKAKDFHALFLEAIPVRADLSLAKHKFLYWLLVDDKDGVIRYVNKEHEHVINAILTAAGLHKAVMDGKVVNEGEWRSARVAAWSSARFAAWLARRVATSKRRRPGAWFAAKAARVAAKTARSATRLQANSAAQSAWLAAWTAHLAGGSGAESRAWIAISEKLLHLLREAEIPSSETIPQSEVK